MATRARAPPIRATPEQTKILKARFEESPSLTSDQLKHLADQLGLSAGFRNGSPGSAQKFEKLNSSLNRRAATTPQSATPNPLPDGTPKLESFETTSLRGSSPGVSVVSAVSASSSSKRPRKRVKKNTSTGQSSLGDPATKAVKLEIIETSLTLQEQRPLAPLQDSHLLNKSAHEDLPPLATLLPLIAPAVRSGQNSGTGDAGGQSSREGLATPAFQSTTSSRGKRGAPRKPRGGRNGGRKAVPIDAYSAPPTFQVAQFENIGPATFGGNHSRYDEAGPPIDDAPGRQFKFVTSASGFASRTPRASYLEPRRDTALVRACVDNPASLLDFHLRGLEEHVLLSPLMAKDAVLNPTMAPLKHLTDVLESFRDEEGGYALLLDANHRERLMLCLLDDDLGANDPFKAAMGLLLLERLGLVVL